MEISLISSVHDAVFLIPGCTLLFLGTIHCIFHATGHHYTWKKVTTTVHNIIVGKLWIDQVSKGTISASELQGTSSDNVGCI